MDSTEVDLVVTDLRMPKMDGFELLAHMSGQYPNIPVIVMTAYDTPEIEERLKDMGVFNIWRSHWNLTFWQTRSLIP